LLKSGVQEISLMTDRVEQSSDLAYEVGRYSLTVKPLQGETITDRGKYVVVWRRQADGKWKASADIFNTSMPPQASAAPASPQKK
jgi:ketosteroid isomerase-like protein